MDFSLGARLPTEMHVKYLKILKLTVTYFRDRYKSQLTLSMSILKN